MRTLTILTLAMLFSVCHTSPVAGDDQKQPEHSILLSAGEAPFVFGRIIPLRVSYQNGGKVAWVIPTPTESANVGIRFRTVGSKGLPAGYDLGQRIVTTRKLPSGLIIEDISSPIPKPVSIASGKSHQFQVEFERDWSGHVVPGRWSAWVKDETLELESNHVEIPLEFAPDSVKACFEITVDTDQYRSKRKQHAEWLQKLMPDLQLDGPRSNDPEAIQKQKEVRIQTALKEFASFWEREKDSESMTEAIRKINEAAGLKPAAAKVP